MKSVDIEKIAMVCHETNRAWCAANGDFSQVSWESAAQWQKDSAIEGVKFRLANPTAGNEAQHEEWLKVKIEDGWTYGVVKDAVKKTHPCILPYHELPVNERIKDALFRSVVDSIANAD